MSRRIEQQLSFSRPRVDHRYTAELVQIDAILARHRAAVIPRVASDLRAGMTGNRGREGMHPEAVLRALVLKQMNGHSYEELSFHLADSATYRWFLGYGWESEPPKRAALQQNISRISEETLIAVNRLLLKEAQDAKIESAERVRIDTTPVSGPIHPPTDSSLLWDVVRVLVRLLVRANAEVDLCWSDHTKRAKRRTVALLSAKRERRTRLYVDLVKVTRRTVGYAQRALATIQALERDDLARLATELKRTTDLGLKVINQTERRVIRKEKVPVADKVLSIFEPDTDLIVRGQRDPVYGHKLCVSIGASGMILDAVVHDGNPTDSTLAVDAVRRLKTIGGTPPTQVAMDGGFSSRDNLKQIKALDVKDVVFSKHLGIAVADMASTPSVFRALRRFRAGVEGCISFLKRCFGLSRCTWKGGMPSFKRYVAASVLSANLLVLARHQLA